MLYLPMTRVSSILQLLMTDGELNDTLPEDALIRFDVSVHQAIDTDNAFKS
jgi:hypothetical protein